MKNEIELKEELLLLEAEYFELFNRSQTKGCKYWYNKDKQNKANELSSTMSKCRREIESLSNAKTIREEIQTLKTMRSEMESSMKGIDVLPISYISRLESLNNNIRDLEEMYRNNYVEVL